MEDKRMKEIEEAIMACAKSGYLKSEKLNGMCLLQQAIVGATYNSDHAAIADLKIWDVVNYLEQLNDECGNIAEEELNRFKEGSKKLCNLIKAEISGNRGEYKAFKTLEYLRCSNRVLKNVELCDEGIRTELDAVVITSKCVTIVEVKNTSKDIFIDEEGNYYRTGEFLRWDANIAEKMLMKERLLRKVMEEAGYNQIKIRSIVVFTNNRIEVQNKYRNIRTSFLSQLTYIIESYKLDDVMSYDDMEELQQIILNAEDQKTYPLEMDVTQYVKDFAQLLAKLEKAKSLASEENESFAESIDAEVEEHKTITTYLKKIFSCKHLKYVAVAAATLPVAVVTGIIAANTINKGGFQK